MKINADWFVGAQVVEADNNGIVVEKDGELYNFYFDEDYGDCCGFNEFNARLLYKKDSKRNPVITRVETRSGFSDSYGDSLEITFFGEHKALARIQSESSSSSGWCYGATVSLKFCASPRESLELKLTEW